MIEYKKKINYDHFSQKSQLLIMILQDLTPDLHQINFDQSSLNELMNALQDYIG
jgi:hypothetical protein